MSKFTIRIRETKDREPIMLMREAIRWAKELLIPEEGELVLYLPYENYEEHLDEIGVLIWNDEYCVYEFILVDFKTLTK